MDSPIPDIIFPIITLTIGTVIAAYSWQRSRIVAVIAMSWAILSLFTAQIPYFQNPDRWTEGDLLGYNAFNAVFTIPIIVLVIASWRSSEFRKFMNDTPVWVLTASQLYRLSGATLLLYYFQDLLPAEIGISNGVLDIIIGMTALPLAWALYRGFSWSRNFAIIWNFVGLFDFVAAAAVITLSFFGVIEISPVPARMGLYPLSLITVYQVAIAFFIHIHLLQRLFRNESSTTLIFNTSQSTS